MGKMLKKIMSITLIVSMILGSAYTFESDKKNVYAAENNSGNAADYAQVGNDIKVSSDTSMGKLIADKLSQADSEQQSNDGYNVFSVNVQGKSAEAEFECTGDAQLIVAIYSEDGTEYKGMGKADIEQADKKAQIDIEIDTMPEFFLIKAFMIDDTMSPLCKAYESTMYTKEMQDFLSKTTDDFDKDKVLNLDSDKTNNFAVYKDDVTRVSSGNNNTLVSYDDAKGEYRFSNVNSTITQLKSGDIFAYNNNGTEIIVKVDRIVVNGTEAIIYSQETSLEEVFDYVKIDESQDAGDATVDTTDMQPGVVYNGMTDYTGNVDAQNEGIESYNYPEAVKAIGVDVEGAYEKEADFKFSKTPVKCDDNNYAEVDGELKLAAKAGVKVYVTLNYQYIEVKIDLSAYLKLSLIEKLGGDIRLGELGFSPCPGVNVGFEITVVIKADVNLEASGKLECTVGFSYDSSDGFKNISRTPTFNSKIDISGQIYLGLSLETKIIIISEKLAKAWLKGETGAVVEAKAELDGGKEGEYTHDCLMCIDGEIYGKIHVSAGVRFFDNDNLSLIQDIVKIDKIPITNFYFSCTYGDGGWGKCPHYKYKVHLVVVNNSDDTAHDTEVLIDGKDRYVFSNKDEMDVYLSNGEHEFVYSKYGYNDVKRNLKVNGSMISQYIRLQSQYGDKENKIVDVQISSSGYTAAITKNGDLYMWGKNTYGQLGDGTTTDRYSPVKIMEKVVSVSLGSSHSAAITEKGNLYVWGRNQYGQLGDGTTEDRYYPKKIMESVAYLDLGNFSSAVITDNGTLYTWGLNREYQLGDGTNINRYSPQKIMENVARVEMYYENAMAITLDKNLYTWGKNQWGQLGDGTDISINEPKKVMNNIEYASIIGGVGYGVAISVNKDLYAWGYGILELRENGTDSNKYLPEKMMGNIKKVDIHAGGSRIAAVTTNGELYMWGANEYGQLGDGTTTFINKPKKIMDNIVDISTGGNSSAAVTTNGELYMWGANEYGQLGDGTTTNNLIPKKIMKNVVDVKQLSWNSAALTEDGELYIWGKNQYGQLGDGTTTDKYTPVKVNLSENSSIQSYSTLNNNTYISVTNTETPETGKVTKYLAPQSQYMMYVVKSDTEQNDILSTDNIIYVNQMTTDSEGKMEYEYNPSWKDAHIIIIGQDNNLQYDSSGYVKGIKDNMTLSDLDDILYRRYVVMNGEDNSYKEESDYIKTGDILHLLDSKGDYIYSYSICVKGDVDGNGSIDVLDMEAIQKSILGIGDKLSGVYKEAASLTDSDDITVLDMEAIQKDILGIQKIN